MGETTAISWCHHTFNPWWGCVKVSPACANCYAETFAKRVGEDVWGQNAKRRFFGDKHWAEPLRWNAAAERARERRRVFCASMADVFEVLPEGHPSYVEMANARLRLWWLIHATPALDWLLLTKRPENAVLCLTQLSGERSLQELPMNIWLGITAERQEEFDIRWPHLRTFPARVRFISYEPALGPLVLPTDALAPAARLWVIAGGESGGHAKPSHPEWFRSIRNQCLSAAVPFHFKQWGEWVDYENLGARGWEHVETRGGVSYGRLIDAPQELATRLFPTRYPFIDPGCHTSYGGAGPCMVRAGQNCAGRALDGREWVEFPAEVSA